jgi:hypothetical protein
MAQEVWLQQFWVVQLCMKLWGRQAAESLLFNGKTLSGGEQQREQYLECT